MSNTTTIQNLTLLLHTQIPQFPTEAILTFIHAYLLQSEQNYVTLASLSPCEMIYPNVRHEPRDESRDEQNDMDLDDNDSDDSKMTDDVQIVSASNGNTRKRKRDEANGASERSSATMISSREERDFQELLGTKDQFARIKSNLLEFLQENHTERIELSAALSRVLCRIAKLKRLAAITTRIQSRIVVFLNHEDINQQYVPVMNAIFAAQRMSVTIDACILGEHASPYLQVACDQTGGSYLRPYRTEGLIQYLFQHFIIDADLRGDIPMATSQETQHFRAVCFETKEKIDQAFVCSVCLSIFKEKKSKCPTCGESFRRVRQVAKPQAANKQ